ncbi:MAG: DUF2059 domain-containing protein [Kiritimatiellia bacterium]
MKTGIMILAAVLAAGNAFAQAKDAKQVEYLLDIQKMEDTCDNAVMGMLKELFATTPDLKIHQDIVVEYTEERVSWQALRPDVVKVYSEFFTDDDVKELIKFYNSKLGQKVLAVTPAINDRMRELTKNRFEADLDVLELKMKNRELDMLVEEASFFKPDKPEPEQKP